jgi:lysozyme family protein
MAQGTGLPTISADAISPLVDMAAFGAGERAAADAYGKLAAGLKGLHEDVLAPELKRKARSDAARSVASGRFDPMPAVTEYGREYTEAITTGSLARMATDDDLALDAMVVQSPYEADAFERASEGYLSAAIKDTPGSLAVQRAERYRQRRSELSGNMRIAQARRDVAEAGAFVLSRTEELERQLAAKAEAAAAFEVGSADFAAPLSELASLYGQMAENPVLSISAEEADRRRQAGLDRFTAAAVAGHVRRTFREQGAAAALSEVQALLPRTDEETPDAEPSDREGVPTPALTTAARTLALELSRQALAEEQGLAQQQSNILSAQRIAAEQRVDSLIEAMRYGGAVDPQALRSAAEATGDPGTMERARFAIEVGVQPPEGFGAGGAGAGGGGFDGDSSAAAGFQAAVDFVIDEIEGGDAYVADDNGRGPTRFGINGTANPDLNIATLTRSAAINRYRRNYWDAIDADELPPALALVAFDAAVNHGPADAKRWIEESGGDVGRYLALREADYRSLAASNPQQARNLNGWLNRLQTVRQRAARVQAFQNNQDGFATDPIAFALGGANRPALANITPLPIDAVFTPQHQAAWGGIIAARRATGDALATQYQVPRRMLTDGEVAAYKDRFERDPVSAITFAQAATSALGGQGARDLLAEVGQGGAAPTIIHIADLSRPGGDTRFAAQAAQGLAYKAGGQALAPDDREAVVEAVNRFRTSFRASPALLSAVQSTAEAAALADQATGRVQAAQYYAQAAMGRTSWQGRAYGGGAAVNGTNVVVPRWLNPEYFDDALEALAERWGSREIGPVYANGQPIPARRVAQLHPVLMANGRYRLVNPRGDVALARNGQVFEVDLDAGREYVRQRLGSGAVRPN